MPLSYPVAAGRLDNGLAVVVSEDHSTPTVAVDLRYNAGSRHDALGRTGQAHLFEHMMFGGSANVASGEHFALIQAAGGYTNAATSDDHTFYVAQVPAGALELVLWLEADRLASHLQAVTEEALQVQKAVIYQEWAQRFGNQPFGSADRYLREALFPLDHPYRNPIIGSMEDLRAASLADTHDFFTAHYLPNNAVLSVVGDVSAEQVFKLASHYFDQIPPGSPPEPAAIPELGPLTSPIHCRHVEDRAPFPLLLVGFRAPVNSIAPDAEILAADQALAVLGEGDTSRLHRRLVEAGLAQAVATTTRPGVCGTSWALIQTVGMPGVDPEQLAAVVNEELEDMAEAGPTPAELRRRSAALERDVLADLAEPQQRASYLSTFALHFGEPAAVNTMIDRMCAVRAETVWAAADRWLRPKHAAVVTFAPSSTPPAPTAPATTDVPEARTSEEH